MSEGVRAFLWDKSQERPADADFRPVLGDWWDQYYATLVKSGRVSEIALQEVGRSSRDIAGLLPRVGAWTRPNPFKGIVVGAVQSGKTQSMMGVSAVALDSGFRIVVVLAGLKDDLRAQTARRFNTDLLLRSDPIPGIAGATTLGKPRGNTGDMCGYAPPFHVDVHDYAPLSAEMAKELRAGRPCIVVAKKHPVSLSDLGMVLAELYTEFGSESLPTLILDDECDEATVPGGEYEKAVPESILGLWNKASPHPPVAYIGYTATAAANLLQHPDWSLYPHWTYLLRYPGGSESAIEFQEPIADNWYSGANCYYSDFGDQPGEDENFLMVPTIDPDQLRGPLERNVSFMDALHAFFVGAAYRLALNPDYSFEDLRRLPKPHSMMIHTSAAQEDHSLWARGIGRLFGVADDFENLDVEKLTAALEQDESPWKDWFKKLSDSRERIYLSRPHPGTQTEVRWLDVRKRLPDVFKNVRVKMVNSDDEGSSLDFAPAKDLNGNLLSRPDVFLIAIGGSRLSRGITVEGLCVSYFARWARIRHDDTVLQMCRWFGYRGKHLEFCRLFTTPTAYLGLKEAAENDLALRAQLAVLMRERKSPQDVTLAFRASPYSRPTSKTGDAQDLDLAFSPFSKVLSRIECGQLSKENEQWAVNLVNQIRARNPEEVTRSGGQSRGRLSRDWSILEVAHLLDQWRFSDHNPPNTNNLMGKLYREAEMNRAEGNSIDYRRDPYQVAAYLRHWHQMALSGKWAVAAPRFNVAYAYGEMDASVPFDYPLLNRVVSSDCEVVGGWTGSTSNWRGDVLFDNPDPALLDDRNGRLTGCNGLVLLYVVHKDAVGKLGRGFRRTHHSPFLGICIPSGGPHFNRILSPSRGPLVEH